MKIKINSEQITTLLTKQRLFNVLSRTFTKTYIKITPSTFHIYLRGSNGVFETVLPVDNLDNFTDTKYVSVDYLKWQNTLQKFDTEKGIVLDLLSNTLKVHEENSTNSVSLGISTFRGNTSDVTIINTFIPTKKTEIQDSGLVLHLNDELISDFDMAGSLFVVQGHTNSIGLSSSDVMYADRSIVLRINLENPVEDEFFENLSGDTHVYLHSEFLDLFEQVYKYNPDIYFSEDYNIIYWTDDVSSIILASNTHEIALPDEDDWNNIKPADDSTYFTSSLSDISTSLDFFTGFYESSMWKPLTFSASKKDGVTLLYKHPTAEVTRSLPTNSCTADGVFQIDSETLKKLIVKISKNYDSNEEMKFNFDDDALGIYCTVQNRYEMIISKLDSDD